MAKKDEAGAEEEALIGRIAPRLRILRMFRSLALFLFPIVLANTLTAQTSVEAGVALGRQSYESRTDDPKTLLDVEALALRRSVGIHLALDFAKLSQEGMLTVVHPDVVYRWTLPANFALMIGGGPSYAHPGGPGGGLTWNAELELDKRWQRAVIFARMRLYDYGLPRFREGEAGPNGPAVYTGVRLKL